LVIEPKAYPARLRIVTPGNIPRDWAALYGLSFDVIAHAIGGNMDYSTAETHRR
jgi:hypothetical protein